MAKKVCILTSAHPALDVRIFRKECRSLVRGGYHVTLIAPILESCRIEGIQVQAFPQFRRRFERFLKGWRIMYRAAKREDADIYHFHDPELIPVALLLRVLGKKVVYDVHEDLPNTISYKQYVPAWLRKPLQVTVKITEEFAGRFMNGVVAATAPIVKRFPKARHRVVVHNYPLLEEFPTETVEPAATTGDYVAYVGARITTARGANEMVQAMGLLAQNLPLRLKLAGSFDPPALAETLSKQHGWNRTEWVGVLGRTGVTRLLRGARAGLVVLHPEPNYLNSEPVKLFEYMAAGIPVIASDFPVWRNLVASAGCGLLVNPIDPAATARAIEYLWSHPAEAVEMGCRGRAAVEAKYNWNREAERLLEFYGEIAGPAADVISSRIEARV